MAVSPPPQVGSRAGVLSVPKAPMARDSMDGTGDSSSAFSFSSSRHKVVGIQSLSSLRLQTRSLLTCCSWKRRFYFPFTLTSFCPPAATRPECSTPCLPRRRRETPVHPTQDRPASVAIIDGSSPKGQLSLPCPCFRRRAGGAGRPRRPPRRLAGRERPGKRRTSLLHSKRPVRGQMAVPRLDFPRPGRPPLLHSGGWPTSPICSTPRRPVTARPPPTCCRSCTTSCASSPPRA
jgi:hypothetical protein